jgi:hypothetical protein
MKRIKNYLSASGLVAALCLGLAFIPQSGHGVVLGDTNNLAGAVYLATNNQYPRKTIILEVSDTNTCSACRALASSGWTSTTPPINQFLRESFVYWPCGPDEHCTAYTQWLGTGTIPVPEILMIDPMSTGSYFSASVGYGGADGLFNTLRLGLLRGTSPYITRLQEANNSGNGVDITAVNWRNTNTVSFNNIVVKCRSISTNVVLYRVKYKLDTTNGWTSLVISNAVACDLPLNASQIVSGANVLRIYGTDINGNVTRTNVFTFKYNSSGVVQSPTTTTLNSAPNPSTYGQSVTLSATVVKTSDSSPVTIGTVTFKEGATTLGTGTPNGSGIATLPVSNLSVSGSPHSLTAVYTDDSNTYVGSTSAARSQSVTKATPTITTSPTASRITAGQALSASLLSGGAGSVAGAFAWSTPAFIPPSGPSSQAVTFTPTDTANYNTASGTASILVIPLGDANGDGTVDATELSTVAMNYWASHPIVTMTNPVALSNHVFQFAVTNINGLALRVSVSSDLTNWSFLTNALPVYQFRDATATGGGPRYYKLAP